MHYTKHNLQRSLQTYIVPNIVHSQWSDIKNY